MISYIATCSIFNNIEYFSYLTITMLSIALFFISFFILITSSQFTLHSINSHDCILELCIAIMALLLIFLFITPSLTILLDSESSIIPGFIMYSLGYQWAWLFNIVFGNALAVALAHSNTPLALINTDTLLQGCAAAPLVDAQQWIAVDHYIIPSISYRATECILEHHASMLRSSSQSAKGSCVAAPLLGPLRDAYCSWDSLTFKFDLNSCVIIPILCSVRFIVYSIDVIHSLGLYSLGIKIDAVPGRSIAVITNALVKGEHHGFCFELCGEGHSSMSILCLAIVNIGPHGAIPFSF